MVEGQNRRGRPDREWMDDITEWCRVDVGFTHTQHHGAGPIDMQRIVVEALDTKRVQAQGMKKKKKKQY